MSVTFTGLTTQAPANTVTFTGLYLDVPPNSVTFTGLSAITPDPTEVVLNKKGVGAVSLQRKGTGVVTLHRVPVVPVPLGISGNWLLIWQDEFNEDLDPSVWMKLRGTGQGYGNPYASDNDDSAFSSNYATVENGNLRIRWDATPITWSGQTFPYTTGIAHTGVGFNYLYGYIEARIWIPTTVGIWPAFWLLPLPVDDHWPPEIDIAEWLHNDQTSIIEPHFNVHYVDSNNQAQQKGWETYGSADVGGSWHVYGLNWQPGEMQMVFDGIAGPKYTDASHIPSEAMYIILSGGVRKGFTPEANNILIDYVRVWQ